MLIAVDSNDSMKQLERRQKVGGQVLGILKEWLEKRVGGGDYFMSSEDVDQWDQSNWPMWPGYQPPKGKVQQAPCSDDWLNMKEAKTKKAFGAFDKTGIFVALCRHQFILKLLNMIQTGEQSKYFLSFLYNILTATKEDREQRGLSKPRGSLGVGYNIACHLVNLLMRSLLGKMAEEEQVKLLMGILHGYGHKRLCQLDFLMIYILGAGNEDLEVCEQFFSITNGLAPVVRHSSR
uniref:Uncharacterized protein n=1 Tax=Moniliophthora roreri TaxID=221103 RepID=A0A0W0GB76_MONRR